MDWLKVLLSRDGSLNQSAFWYAALALYVAGLASQVLLSSTIAIIPYAISQIVLLWSWYVIHAKRLRDAAYPQWPVVTVTALFTCLLAASLIILALFFALQSGKPVEGGARENAVAFYLMIAIGGVLLGVFDPTGITPILIGLLIVMFAPGVIALGFTIWAGTRKAAAPQVTYSAPTLPSAPNAGGGA